jgi:hypothetical protein
MRCNKETIGTIMSMYNEDMICMDCKTKETERPDYEKARDAEYEAVKNGNRNFKGIGYK